MEEQFWFFSTTDQGTDQSESKEEAKYVQEGTDKSNREDMEVSSPDELIATIEEMLQTVFQTRSAPQVR